MSPLNRCMAGQSLLLSMSGSKPIESSIWFASQKSAAAGFAYMKQIEEY
jgi:hypothetical protein